MEKKGSRMMERGRRGESWQQISVDFPGGSKNDTMRGKTRFYPAKNKIKTHANRGLKGTERRYSVATFPRRMTVASQNFVSGFSSSKKLSLRREMIFNLDPSSAREKAILKQSRCNNTGNENKCELPELHTNEQRACSVKCNFQPA